MATVWQRSTLMLLVTHRETGRVEYDVADGWDEKHKVVHGWVAGSWRSLAGKASVDVGMTPRE
jgi:hypothetical protein